MGLNLFWMGPSWQRCEFPCLLEPPVTVRLTENVILSEELTPHGSVYIHEYHKLSLHLFKDLMKFVHKRNYFNCSLTSSKSVIPVFTSEGISYYRACEDFFSHINFW